MKLFKRSLRNRFFFSLITLVFGATILIAAVTIFQYQDEAEHYQRDKLQRKVASIEASIDYQIENTTYPVNTKHIPLIFKDKIYEISHIHDTQIKLYDLEGNLLKSSQATFLRHPDSTQLDVLILNRLKNSIGNHFYSSHNDGDHKYLSSFSYITDKHFKPLAILSLPHIENFGFMEKEIHDFLLILGQVYFLLIIAAIILSYFFSRYITKSIDKISTKIHDTRVDQKNQKILMPSVPLEIKGLIKAYNSMVDELEESAVKLATSEREQAWREMAKQVAHEIKNPLTPMRLNMQSFEYHFDPKDPDIKTKLHEFSQSMIEQIDTMSTIASAFSNFAEMPQPKNERLNVPEVIKTALDIFEEGHISFATESEELYTIFDRTQLIRVITNLIKNAYQATKEGETPQISVSISCIDELIQIDIADKGTGIADEHKQHIFEPKFTTKTSGMGLGLGIIKQIIEAYKGQIYFKSQLGKGTTFTVKIPKHTS